MKVMAWLLMKLRSYTNWIPTAWLIAYEIRSSTNWVVEIMIPTGVTPTGQRKL